jgi:hypothetical protein
MLDNIKNIIPLLIFQENIFYEVLVLQHNKNNSNVKVIKHYMVDSLEELLNNYDDMKLLADNFNAIVYIKLGSYSKEKLGYKILETLSKKLQNKELDYSELVEESIGKLQPNSKFFIVDIDYKDVSINDVLRIKTVINDCEPNGRNVIAEIPTPNGIHIITRPFNTQQFLVHQSLYYKCEVRKNNSTILYSNIK